MLVSLVEAYEREHYPIGFPDSVEAIKFRMEQQGLSVDDLVPVIGRNGRDLFSLGSLMGIVSREQFEHFTETDPSVLETRLGGAWSILRCMSNRLKPT